MTVLEPTIELGSLKSMPLTSFVENFVNDKYLVRKMSALVQGNGFEVQPLRSYGLVETLSPGLTMSWIDRGADALVQNGTISSGLADALKA